MKEHDLFLVDDRIVPEMPRVLGKQWLQAKKSPIPVTLKRVDLKAELERAIASTYLRINKGTSYAIKIGSLAAHTSEQLRENLLAIIPHLAVRIPNGGWDNVQSLHIKTTTSMALPLWNCSLAEDGEGEAAGRFFIPEINEEEVEAKKKAKQEKDERIRGKKQRKLDGVARRLAIEAASEESDEDGDEDEEDAEAEAESGSGADESMEPEEIDETPSSGTPKASKRTKSLKPVKAAASPAGTERKKVSSTSKKVKGLDGVKGLPKKSKASKA
jgi:ribosome biogenesis protein UTP30